MQIKRISAAILALLIAAGSYPVRPTAAAASAVSVGSSEEGSAQKSAKKIADSGSLRQEGETVSGTCGTDASYVLENGVLTISGTGEIEEDFFDDYDLRYDITSIIIGEGITKIGSSAFYDFTAVKSVTLPSTLEYIDRYAFEDCYELTQIDIPASVAYIGYRAFDDCSLKELDILNSECALDSHICSSSVVIGGKKGSTAEEYSRNCNTWFKDLDTGVKSMSGNCGENASYVLTDDLVLTISGTGVLDSQIYLPVDEPISLVIEDGITGYNDKLTDFDGFVVWGGHYTDLNYRSVTVPDTFENPIGLISADTEELIIKGDSPAHVTKDGAIYSADMTKLEYVFPTAKTTVTDDYGNESEVYPAVDTPFEVPSTVTEIGEGAFKNSNYTDIILPETVTKVGKSAFILNIRTESGFLRTVTVNNKDCEFEYYDSEKGYLNMFSDECAVKGYADSTTQKAAHADGVLFINIETGEETHSGMCGENAEFSIVNNVMTITGSGAVKFSDSVANDDITDVVIGEGITEIGSDCFARFTAMKTVSLPSTLTAIKIAAFEGCSSLESVKLPNGLTEISSSMFQNCTALKSIEIPDSVTAIGNYAFMYCSSLTELTLPESVAEFDVSAVANCEKLEKLTVMNKDCNITDIWGYGAMGNNLILAGYAGSTINKFASENVLRFCDIETGEVTICGDLDENISYKLADGVLTITGTGDMPETSVFRYRDDVESVVIGSGITSICSSAFYKESNLTSVSLPEGLKTIGEYAFAYTSVKNITLPEGLETISNGAFCDCDDLVSVVIPEGVTDIGEYAFYYCSSLKSVKLPSTIKNINDVAFSSCYELEQVTIPDAPEHSVKLSGNPFGSLSKLIILDKDCDLSEFSSDSSLVIEGYSGSTAETFALDRSLVFVDHETGDTVIQGKLGEDVRYKIIDGVLDITGTGAIVSTINLNSSFLSDLKEISIGEGITMISGNLFNYSVSSVKTIRIPSTLTSIDPAAFDNCSASLTALTVSEENTAYTSSGTFLLSKDGKTLVFAGGSASIPEIPSTVTAIGRFAFKDRDELEEVVLPESVESIGEGAFAGCDLLKKITIKNPECVISPESYTISNTYSNYYDYDAGTYKYESGYYYGILAGKGGSTAEKYAFSNGLKFLDLDTSEVYQTGKCGDDLTYEIKNNVLTVKGTGEMYDSAFTGNTEITDVSLPEGLTSISNYAFRSCLSLKSVSIPSTVTTIGSYAFGYCSGLRSVVIPEGVAEIGEYAFCDCDDLVSVVIPGSVKTIGGDAFSSCDDLEEVTLNEGIETIGSYAFEYTNIQSIELPESVKKVESSAFYNCYSLNAVTIKNRECELSDYNTTIQKGAVICGYADSTADEYAFRFGRKFMDVETGKLRESGMCGDSLTFSIEGGVLTISGSGEMWDTEPFYDNDSISSVVIGDGVTSISDTAFRSCDNLTSVNIPAGIKKIGRGAFQSCDMLSSFTVDPENNNYSSSDGVIYNKDMTELVIYPYGKRDAEFIVPASVTKISGTFQNSYIKEIGFQNNKTVDLSGASFNSGIIFCGYAGSTAESYAYEYGMYFRNYETGEVRLCGRCGESLVYEMTTDGELTITGTGDMYNGAFMYNDNIKTVVIGEGVTSVSEDAFYDCDYIVSMTLPSTIKSIGNYAFYYNRFETLVLPEGLQKMGYSVFLYSRLKTVNIPASLAEIGDSAFDSSYLKEFTGGEGNQSFTVKDGILYNKDMTRLVHYPSSKDDESYTLPETVTELERRDLYKSSGINALTEVVITNKDLIIEDSSETINPYDVIVCAEGSTAEKYAFKYGRKFRYIDTDTILKRGKCGENLTYEIKDGVLTVEGTGDMSDSPMFSGDDDITSAVISEGVTSIGIKAFEGCNNLEQITIAGSVAAIGADAFNGCGDLEYVNIPAAVNTIGGNVFVGCENLKGIVVDAENQKYSSVDGVLFNKDKTELIAYPESKADEEYTIPDTVLTIGDYAFDDCNYLNTVTIPEGVAGIGYYAFRNCNKLSSVALPSTVKSIGNAAFCNTSIKEINIPDGVTKICDSTFYSCDELVSVELGKNIEAIEYNAFSDCRALSSITILNDKAVINSEASTISSSAMICGYADSTANEYALRYGRKFKDLTTGSITQSGKCGAYMTFTINDGVLAISGIGKMNDDPLFSSNSEITSVVIEDGVTSIGNNAFSNCTKLETITIPDSVVSIGDNAFYNCSSLKEITLPENISELSTNIFDSCESLEKAVLPAKLLRIGDSAFRDCYLLKEIEIPADTVSIGYEAFANCHSLEKAALPSGLDTIYDRAFAGCTSLKDFTIPSGLTGISGSSLAGTKLESIGIEEGNTTFTVDNGMLLDSTGTTLIIYPAGKKDTEFTVPSTVTEIGEYAFYRNDTLEKVTIPKNVKTIGNYAFLSVSVSTLTILGADCSIEANAIDNVSCIEGYSGSTAEEYAFRNAMLFRDIETGEEKISGKYNDITYTIKDGVLTLSGSGNDFYIYNQSITKVVVGKDIRDFSVSSDNITEYVVDAENTVFCAEDGVLYNKDKTRLIRYPREKKDEKFIVPDTVKTIDSISSSYLKEIVLGSSVDFRSQSDPNQYNIYIYGDNIEKITVSEDNPNLKSVDGVLYTKDMSALLFYPYGKKDTEFTVPDAVEKVYSMYSPYIEKLNIGAGLTFRYKTTFTDEDGNVKEKYYYSLNLSLPGLTEVTVSASNPALKAVDGVLFSKDMTQLLLYPIYKADTEYTIPDGVETARFGESVYLEKLNIGKELKEISFSGYYYDSPRYLKEINVDSGNPVFMSKGGILYRNDTDGTPLILLVPHCLSGDVVLIDGITVIPYGCFVSRDDLRSVTIPKSVTKIMEYAFYNCSALENVTILNPECAFVNDQKYNLNNLYSDIWDEETQSYILKTEYNGTITAKQGSEAQKYAEATGYTFKDIDAQPEVTTTTTTTSATTTTTTSTTTSTTTTTTTSTTTTTTDKATTTTTEPVTTTTTDKVTTTTTDKATNTTTSAGGDAVTTTTTGVDEFTVSFESNGGSGVAAQIVQYCKTALEPDAPTRDGFTFTGWFTDEALTSLYDFTTEVKADITLYAGWNAVAATTTTTSATTTTTTTTEVPGSSEENGSTTTTAQTPETTTTTAPTPVDTLGDVNDDGAVDSSDAALILRQYADVQAGKAGSFTPEQIAAADFNNDEMVDSSDAALILKAYADAQAGK